jgi:Kef-type K+ transport system membrane component KefB
MLIGPSVFGWVETTPFIDQLAELGLAMLFFLAGNEIDFRRIKGRPLNRSVAGWLISLAVGVTVGVLLAPTAAAGVFVGVALTSTALGTLMPILRDAGELRTPFGGAIIAIGAVGEFGPLIAISLFLSGRNPGIAAVVLIGFVGVTAVAIYLAGRRPHPRLQFFITASLRTSGQFAIRLVMLLMLSLVALSIALDLDMLLGAFAAGVITKLLLSGATPAEAEIVDAKLEAVGFGFLVPVFFINTGVTFDLDALLSSTAALLLLPVFLVLLLLVRGLTGLLTAPRGSAAADKRAIVLFSATGLPIIVAVTAIGVDSGDLAAGTAASLVGAGMLSVLLFPLVGLAQHRKAPDGSVKPPDLDDSVVEEG